AVPAFALACAPYLRDILSRLAAQRVLFWVAASIATLTVLAIPYVLLYPERRTDIIASYHLDPLAPLPVLAAVLVSIFLFPRPRRGIAAFSGTVLCALLVVSFWINPAMNDARSGRAFMERVERTADPYAPLGFVAFKEQYMLQVQRPVVHFGHARWREGEREA